MGSVFSRKASIIGALGVVAALGAAVTVFRATGSAEGSGAPLSAEIRTTSYGVPHVLAKDLGGAGFGLGYAFAQSNICEIAGRWVTVNAQRSRYFGPEGEKDGNTTNLQSDFFWKKILDTDVVGRELALPAPAGPSTDVRELVSGYVAGYNKYLAETGVASLPDARCRGQEWVRPITDRDVYLRSLHWNLFRTLPLVPALTTAAPPSAQTADASLPAPLADDRDPLAAGLSYVPEEFTMPASNMIALGSEATDNGKGMMFANPHWQWRGPERWYEAHLSVPGKLNVNGAGILGVPVVIFGHNQNVAWSHTAATPKRWTVYALKLADSPTSYVYDGKVRQMTSKSVTIEVKEADGRIGTRSHTFWETHYGPMFQDTTFGWNGKTAYALRLASMNFRWISQQLAMNQSQSVEELDTAGRKYLGIGWLNTMAADSSGHAIYADRTAVPNVTNALVDRCAVPAPPPGPQGQAQQGPPATHVILDGSRGECEWASDAAAPVPGIFGPSKLPQLPTRDYVAQANNSHWLNSLRHPLEGYDTQILGDERTERSARTRNGLVKIERRLTGKDGYPGNRFSLAQFESITTSNHALLGELWQEPLVAFCRKTRAELAVPAITCDVLAQWDRTQNPASQGAVLWRRFFENIARDRGLSADAQVFAVPFDAKDPMNTPRGLNTANPRVAAALTASVKDLTDARLPLDAKYGDYHVVERDGARLPFPGGGPGGQYLAVSSRPWDPGTGWVASGGSSYVMWLQFTDKGPVGRSVMTYSQSANPASPNLLDQTRLFSAGKSKPILFDEAAILADPGLTVTKVSASASQTARR